MAIVVQKFGGTSVKDLDCIRIVAEKIIQTRALGYKVVAVVSAMAGETDRLLQCAQELSNFPNPRELDVLLSTGEQVTIALLSIALLERGCQVRSYTGFQVPIRTDSFYNKARILDINLSKIQMDLSKERVVVVAGFQGVDEESNITTLGRDGSDTTAVALSTVLKAEECQIYTDVDGIYTTDPKIVSNALRISEITADEVLEMSSSGSKIIHNRAAEYATRSDVPVRILSTFLDGPGTLILNNKKKIQPKVVTGIAFNRDEVKFEIYGIANSLGIICILDALSENHIEIDMMNQTLIPNQKIDLVFTVNKRDFKLTLSILKSLTKKIDSENMLYKENISKISLIGTGMRSHTNVASTLYKILVEIEINIMHISTSETRISIIIDRKFLERGICALHDGFQLGKEKQELYLNVIS